MRARAIAAAGLVAAMLAAGCAVGGDDQMDAAAGEAAHEVSSLEAPVDARGDAAGPEVDTDGEMALGAEDGDGAARQRGNTFRDHGVGPFVAAAEDPRSTFGLDVDTGSYTVARRWLDDGVLPPAASVRVEEHLNYFDGGYAAPVDGAFALHVDGAPSLTSSGTLLRVGVKAREVDAADRPDSMLTFVIDTSGSMTRDDRLGTVKTALSRLVGELRPTDEVAIVTYSDDATRVLPPTPVIEREAILTAIDGLHTEGSTNLEAGLRLGYAVAVGAQRPGAINRVVLASDGVANVGGTDWQTILDHVQGAVDRDVQLVSVGVGMGNFNDTLLEQLADHGDGFYAYVDTPAEAERLFVDGLTGTLLTVAKDAKVQVEFDPATVARYRLIGFENRDLADEQFDDPAADAGEIGAGHSVTALYEIERTAGAAEGRIATVRLRWIDPDSGASAEATSVIGPEHIAASFDEADGRFRLAATVASWAELLRGSPYAGDVTFADVAVTADRLARELDDTDVAEFARLVAHAADLQR